jgi:hypothetical protein
MVIIAYLDTNIRNINPNEVDQLHEVSYDGDKVMLSSGSTGRGHDLNLSTGQLSLGNIQVPERPVVQALAENYRFQGNKFDPRLAIEEKELFPTRFGFLPTLFELERLAQEPIIINGITRLKDDYRDFNPESNYLLKQRKELSSFLVLYARAVDESSLKKPVVESFYQFTSPKEAREVFGKNLANRLREALGRPMFFI